MENHLDPERPSSPVRQLRDEFGDPKPPGISRKITSCVTCRKQKIKCDMPGAQPPCTRCKKRGLSCTVNRSLQMLLESDAGWKHTMEKKVMMLQESISQLTGTSVGDIGQLLPATGDHQAARSGLNVATRSSDQSNLAESRWDVSINPEIGPGAAPGSYLTQISSAPPGPTSHADLVTKGIISLSNAKLYFCRYQEKLDHFVYRILGEHSTVRFESTRKSSPLLLAAICTIGALHYASNNKDFDDCRAEFVTLAENQSFAQGSIERVRALCIGGFWLTDLSWSLTAAAVRMATDMQLHRSFSRAINGDETHYIRTRLYYHVYACDHHASIAFGRPPMTRECEVIREARAFAGCVHATEDDSRLVSQVTRWSLLTNVFDTFGTDIERSITDTEIAQLRKFGLALDSLRAEWSDRFVPNAHVGNYPRKGVMLQYHFARLYLYSHAFRGTSSGGSTFTSSESSMELEEIANSAVFSALSILRSVIDDEEIQSFLNGLPAYFDVMITFAVVFLMKVSSRPSHYIQLEPIKIKTLLDDIANTLSNVATTLHPRHLLASISKGIKTLVNRFDPMGAESIGIPQAAPLSMTENSNAEMGFDPYFLGAYDLQNSQTMGLGFEYMESLSP